MTSRAGREERGAATLLAIPILALLVLGALVASFVGGALVAQRRAQSAADLAALAGAGSLQRGDDPCRAARSIARRNGVEPTLCKLNGADVLVRVAISPTALFGRTVSVTAEARAGPGA